ncbi:apolipoprotein N-acyltransferase [Methylomonas sp. MgM2]
MIRILEWKRPMLAPVFGAVLALAFAPYDYSYLAIIALMFFYRLCHAQSIRQAAFTGYLFGLGMFGCGTWWVYVSIHEFGGAGFMSSGMLTVLFVALWAIFPAVAAALASSICSKVGPISRITIFAWLWVLVEYVRGYWILNGFPWLQIAYSQLNTPLAGFAPLAGVYGVGFLLSMSASTLYETVLRQLPRLVGIPVLLSVWLGGWLLKDVQWTRPIGNSIKIALMQGNIDQKIKWQPNQQLKTLNLYQELTERHWDSDVIVWPETAIPAFLSDVKTSFLEPLANKARNHGADIVVSLPSNGQGKDYYNSVMTLGKNEALYHKTHLLPFGEYLPLQPLSGWILDQLRIPLGNFAAGRADQPLLRAGGYPVVTTICYEDAFGELVIRQVEHAAYLVNVTNDAWFGHTAEPYQHMQMAQMRALETGRYMARATNTGLSGIVLPNGKIRHQAPLYTTTTLTGEIIPMTGLTPYARYGDRMIFIGLIVFVVTVLGLESRINGGVDSISPD